MKKAQSSEDDELRAEYDLSALGRGETGKYHERALAGTNLVLIDPELTEAFPDAESVNRALRLLMDTAKATARPSLRSRHKSSKRAARSSSATASKR
jgi:hypothetical protein